MLNAIARTNEIDTSNDNSTTIMLGSLALIATLLNVIIVLTNPAMAAAIASMAI
jgi:hypothetical protein